MGFFNKNENNNGYTDLSGMRNNRNYSSPQYYDQNYNQNYNQNYDQNYGQYGYPQESVPFNPQAYNGAYESGISLSDFTRNVYLRMFIGLIITFGIGIIAVFNPEMVINLIGDNIGIFLIICGIEVILVFTLGFFIQKMSPAAATAIFYTYSIVNGITIAPLLVLYDMGTVFWTLAVTAGIFGLMSFVGFITKIDLSKLGPILLFGLIGLIIFSIIAMFFAIPMSDLIICIIGIILFMGFTMYDTKKIKAFYNASAGDPDRQKKSTIIAALQLYLDFVNLFLYILRLFARNRN